MILRKWLKNIRDIKGYTHEDIARICEISRSYYTHIENGTKTPSVQLAKVLGGKLDFNWIIFFEKDCSLKEHHEV